MSDKVTVDGLRDILNQHKPAPFMPKNIDGTVIDMWNVLDNLLNLAEEQEKRIKELEDRLNKGDMP